MTCVPVFKKGLQFPAQSAITNHTVSADCESSQSNRVAMCPEVFVPLDAFLYIKPCGAELGTPEGVPFHFGGKRGNEILTAYAYLSQSLTTPTLGGTEYAKI